MISNVKVLVLSDIHANSIALKAVLSQEKRYSMIVSAGDQIGEGPDPKGTMDILLDNDVIMVAGNREITTKRFLDGSLSKQKKSLQFRYLTATLDLLTNEHKEVIMQLPTNKYILNGEVQIAHGTPDKVDKLVFPEHHSVLNAIALKSRAREIILGHNHIQWVHTHMKKHIIHPGSVGLSEMHDTGRADYAVLIRRKAGYIVRLHHVYYDLEAVRKLYIKNNMFDQGFWGELSFSEMRAGIPLRTRFSKFAFEKYRLMGGQDNIIPDDLLAKLYAEWKQKNYIFFKD